ncbi:MAG: methyltransferase domain-containing protein [Candidatus Marinimicrobia bacterium]|nr:methyltransferase domain-containing protein [Candidatus Neomarinimicrobiota bacterium]MCF7827964.1 methyltransferase domain-containing protein [Candidatus Neomarinimicrobiota bacterium]MCF7879281.1 methyltransferase domain-containing protein [Candidatus Neomarinimicrobiota bacterium]
MAYKFAEKKAAKLEKQQRYTDYKPKTRLKLAGVSQGDRVLDIGSGTGFYTRAAAQLVKLDGFVIGIDILKGMVDKATSLGVPENVEYRISEESEFPVEDDEFDWAIMTNLYHELHEPDAFVKEIHRVLKSGGRVYFNDWIPQEEEDGPPKAHRVPKSTVIDKFVSYGFAVKKEDMLNNSHYEILFRKTE